MEWTLVPAAQKKINQLLADVCGVEFVEPENLLVEDEQENKG